MSDPHPLETPEETVSPLPEPKPFDVPGLRITYTHQASSGRTFGFETFVEHAKSPCPRLEHHSCECHFIRV